jgi:hypothetical protein
LSISCRHLWSREAGIASACSEGSRCGLSSVPNVDIPAKWVCPRWETRCGPGLDPLAVLTDWPERHQRSGSCNAPRLQRTPVGEAHGPRPDGPCQDTPEEATTPCRVRLEHEHEDAGPGPRVRFTQGTRSVLEQVMSSASRQGFMYIYLPFQFSM